MSSNLHRKETTFPQQIFLPLNVIFQRLEHTPPTPTAQTGATARICTVRYSGLFAICLLVGVSAREMKEI